MQVPARLPGQGHIPQDWALPLGKDITTAFKGFAEILTRTAEPIMRYATVYLAIATALPVLRWEPLYYVAMIIVIASPEFVLVGALSIAEAGYKEGRKGWSIILFIVCGLLSIIMTVTFMEVFKILTFSDYAQHILNFARCMVAAGFSVVLPKLDGVSSQSQAVQTPDYTVIMQQLVDGLRSEMQQSLVTLRNDLSAQIDAKIVQPEPLDYVAIIDHLRPTLDDLRTDLSAQIDAKIVQPEPLDYVAIIDHLRPTLDDLRTDLSAQTGAKIDTLEAQIPQVMSVDELALQLAPLLQQSAQNSEQVVDESPDNREDSETPEQEDKPEDENQTPLHMVPSSQPSTKRRQSTRQNVSSETVKKVRRLVDKNASITSTELAGKCNISRSYAASIKKQILNSQPA